MASLSEINEQLLSIIAHAGEDLILGYLPVDGALAESTFTELRRHLREGRRRDVEQLFLSAPAVTAFALIHVPSRFCKSGGDFWGVLREHLGLQVQGGDRGLLASRFRTVCRHLGLVDGTVDAGHQVHVAPFLFQAGILHRWVEPLADAVRRTLQAEAAPDTEDELALLEFTKSVHGRIRPAQSNLRHFLCSQAGPMLIKRLTEAYLASAWEGVPAHLRGHLRSAFDESGRAVVLKRPYLQFDPAFRELRIVLPALSSRITSTETEWRVFGRRFFARQETEVPIIGAGGGNVEVRLCGLTRGQPTQTFEVPTGLSEGTPFLIFRGDGGRERSMDPQRDRHALPAGLYHILMAFDVVTNDEDYVERLGSHRLLEIDLRPGEDPVVLARDDQKWHIETKLSPGISVDHTRGSVFKTLDTEPQAIHHGPSLGFVAHVPTDFDQAGAEVRFCCEAAGLDWTESISLREGTENAFAFFSDFDPLFFSRLGDLPAGVYWFDLTLTATLRVTRRFFYWKGLTHVNTRMGFACEAFPENVDLSQSVGLHREGSSLHFDERHCAPHVLLALAGSSIRLQLPKAGIQVSLCDGDNVEANPQGTAIVAHNDRRFLRFRSGGFQTWEILNQAGKKLFELNRNRTHFTQSLIGLATENRGSGHLRVRDESGEERVLFSFSQPLSALPPHVKYRGQSDPLLWRFKVPMVELAALGVRLTDYSASPVGESLEIVDLAEIREDHERTQALTFADEAIVISALGAEAAKESDAEPLLRVRVEIDAARLGHQFWCLDFFRKGKGDADWVQLQSLEKFGYSDLRILAFGTGLPTAEDGWWPMLRRGGVATEDQGRQDSLASALNGLEEQHVAAALSTSRDLLTWKYPFNVWKADAHRFRAWPSHLAQYCLAQNLHHLKTWLQEGVAELDDYAKARMAPVVRQFLLALRPEILAANRSEMPSSELDSSGHVMESFLVGASIYRAGGLNKFVIGAFDDGTINPQVLFSFQNFVQVSGNRSIPLADFDLSGFLVMANGSVSECMEKLAEETARMEVTTLFSAEHALSACRKLNLRSRSLAEAATSENPDHPLATFARDVQKHGQKVEMVAAALKNHLGWQHPECAYWTPPTLENPFGKALAGLAWVTAAVLRLSAGGVLTPSQRDQHLRSLYGSVPDFAAVYRDGISLLLSFAPELFSLYFGLFELRIPDQH